MQQLDLKCFEMIQKNHQLHVILCSTVQIWLHTTILSFTKGANWLLFKAGWILTIFQVQSPKSRGGMEQSKQVRCEVVVYLAFKKRR